MSNTEKSIFWLCVILTMAMAFAALMISLPRTVDTKNPISLDYQGVIIAVFAVLVTSLIGWQIYNSLGVEHKFFKAEKRISNMLSQLQKAKKAIKDSSQSAEDYSSGINCLSIAMIEYVQTYYNRGLSLEEQARHFCTSYIVSAKAIIYLIKSNKSEQLLSPIIKLCVDGIELSSNQLFNPKLIEYTQNTFKIEDHSACDSYYTSIMKNPRALTPDNIISIIENRKKRQALITSNPKTKKVKP